MDKHTSSNGNEILLLLFFIAHSYLTSKDGTSELRRKISAYKNKIHLWAQNGYFKFSIVNSKEQKVCSKL